LVIFWQCMTMHNQINSGEHVMKFLRIVAGAALCLVWGTASAHTGHAGSGFSGGFSHPFLGVDHLLAMFAVGLWATQQRGWRIWLAPITFVSVMALGSMAGVMGLSLPWVEPGIALSVFLLGLFVALSLRLPTYALIVLTAAFALLHGHAHGAEMPAGASWPYIAGFVLATAALHGSGVGLGFSLRVRALALRGLGLATAMMGAGLLFN
jgi:urease accessory protein